MQIEAAAAAAERAGGAWGEQQSWGSPGAAGLAPGSGSLTLQGTLCFLGSAPSHLLPLWPHAPCLLLQ